MPDTDDRATPVPPPALRRRVHGADDLAGFEHIGRTVSENIRAAIGGRVALDDASRVLDFGCGCGRVMTWVRRWCPGEFHGSDIDPEAIAWCREHLADIARFVANEPWPPLPFADGFFDFVYSISVFTHLPRKMQTAWLAELQRVTRPGGWLLLTAHGEHLLGAPRAGGGLRAALMRLRSAVKRRLLDGTGFVYAAGAGTPGLPKFYGTAFHSEVYIRTHWGRFFDIEAIVPRGIADHQDLVLCRRRG